MTNPYVDTVDVLAVVFIQCEEYRLTWLRGVDKDIAFNKDLCK